MLKDHREIVRITVLILKQQYDQLINTILVDDSSYKVIPADPTSTIQRRANELISNLSIKGTFLKYIVKSLTIGI